MSAHVYKCIICGNTVVNPADRPCGHNTAGVTVSVSAICTAEAQVSPPKR